MTQHTMLQTKTLKTHLLLMVKLIHKLKHQIDILIMEKNMEFFQGQQQTKLEEPFQCIFQMEQIHLLKPNFILMAQTILKLLVQPMFITAMANKLMKMATLFKKLTFSIFMIQTLYHSKQKELVPILTESQ